MAATEAHANCREPGWTVALSSSLEGLTRTVREASHSDWVQGAEWQIFTTRENRLHTIIREDLGERGRREARLTVIGERDYAVTVTTTVYSGNIFTDDVTETVSVETQNFCYSAGKLETPYFFLEDDPYISSGEEARKLMLLDKDVAEFTKELPR
jgi:hypothetical protein